MWNHLHCNGTIHKTFQYTDSKSPDTTTRLPVPDTNRLVIRAAKNPWVFLESTQQIAMQTLWQLQASMGKKHTQIYTLSL